MIDLTRIQEQVPSTTTLAAVGDVSVRAFPFPFVAGLAVNNDVDSMRAEAFLDWHGFVNGHGLTSYGDGLGLEVADSFFVYGGKNQETLCLYRSFPDGDPLIDSPDAKLIVEYSKLGWFDTLHSIGNWRPERDGNDRSKGTKDQVVRALDRLSRLDIRLPLFVNHSESLSNPGGAWHSYYQADDPQADLYCLDLLRQYGIHHFWFEPMVSIYKFGDHLSYFNETELHRELQRFHFAALAKNRSAPTEADPVELPTGLEQDGWFCRLFNAVIAPVPCQDGTIVSAFKRFRGVDQPYMNTFCAQVTSARLDNLERLGGAVVIYQHFGINSLRGRLPAYARPFRRMAEAPVLDKHAVATWRDIAERWRAGRLFVAATARFLRWLRLRESLDFAVVRKPDKWRIRLSHVNCPIEGRSPLSAEDLNGLAFTVPSNAPETIVTWDKDNRKIDIRRNPDGNMPGFDALWHPFDYLEWPEKSLVK